MTYPVIPHPPTLPEMINKQECDNNDMNKVQPMKTIMNPLKILTGSFLCLLLITCLADPNRKKFPHPKGKFKKTTKSTYNPSIDILFIIDDSQSMGMIQDLLAKNADLFIDRFLNIRFIDYHIGVTTSSTSDILITDRFDTSEEQKVPSIVYDGSLAKCQIFSGSQLIELNYVDRKTPEASQCLREMMQVGAEGTGPEQFFNIPSLTLSEQRATKNSSFYRPEAHLAIIAITNSFDQSDFSSKRAYQFLLDLKNGDKEKLHYAAGIVTLPMPQYDCKEEERLPLNFMELLYFFGDRGYQFNLCKFNYGKDLAHFAKHLVDAVLSISLERLPNVNTIKVRYTNKGKTRFIPRGPTGWTYDPKNNTLHLSQNTQVEKAGGTFHIEYESLY